MLQSATHKLLDHASTVNQLLARYGVKFGIYKQGTFREQLFPFDAIPRVIDAAAFAKLERGLKQRVAALNAFLRDIYTEKRIVRDGVVPEDFAFAGNGFLAPCDSFTPLQGVYAHIAGIDLVEAQDGDWFVLEDNLRVPSGASYPMIARDLCRRSSPDSFRDLDIADNRDYATLLRRTFDHVNPGGHTVILTPGRYNAAYFEHSYLAEKTGAHLVSGDDLTVVDGKLYFHALNGSLERVGVVYRRISDDFLDPMTFRPESLIGVPHIFEAYRAGNVALINAPGAGVADDKGIYYFVPKMIRYYLGEDAILRNAPTYLPFYDNDRSYVLANLERLVVKDVAEAGGYGVVFGSSMTREQLADSRDKIIAEPRRFIAQEVIEFKDIDISDSGALVPRKADLRAFVLTSEEPVVWKSGLTRFTRDPASYIVNSSQGGGFKDTWVLNS